MVAKGYSGGEKVQADPGVPVVDLLPYPIQDAIRVWD